jgi:hypothetical protein
VTTGQIKEASPEAICQKTDDVNLALAQRATLTMIMTLSEQIDQIERAVPQADPPAAGVQTALHGIRARHNHCHALP